MESDNPPSSSTSAESQASPQSEMDGYYSGIDFDTFGSRSDESLMNSSMASTAELASRSFETLARRATCLPQSQTNFQNIYNKPGWKRGLHGSSSFDTSTEEVNQTPSEESFARMSSRNQMPMLAGLNGSSDRDNNWRSSSATASREAVQTNDYFLEQVRAFSNLPLHIHKQINQTSGNRIKKHLDVNLVRVHNTTTVASSQCVAVFTTKLETGQYWLMVYVKEGLQNESGSGLRFNRLITPQLDYNIRGQKAIEIDSSKPDSAETIKFIFNFDSVETAAKFVQIVEQLKSTSSTSSQAPKMLDDIGHRASESERMRNSLISTALSQASGGHRSSGRGNFNAGIPVTPSTSTPRVQGVRYAKESTSIFIQHNNIFQLLGTGALKLLHTSSTYDKLVLITSEVQGSNNLTTLMQHCIYKWNEIRVIPDYNEFGAVKAWNCFWTACAEIFGIPGLPKFHAFKVSFGTKGEVDAFYNAFKTSIAVAEQIGCVPAPYLLGFQ